MKIIKVEEVVPRPSTLPDGKYSGKWSGSKIIVHYGARTYELTTVEGIRGVSNVVVDIYRDIMTFEEVKN